MVAVVRQASERLTMTNRERLNASLSQWLASAVEASGDDEEVMRVVRAYLAAKAALNG